MPNASIVPLIVYFEGNILAADELYSYLSSASINIVGYRLLSRDGVGIELGLRKNGTLLDVLDVTGLDSGVQEVPNIYFSVGDTFSITCESVTGPSLEGLTMIFNCTVETAVDNSALTNSLRIQTPLVSRYEGVLGLGDTFFFFLPSQRVEVWRYTATIRNPADHDVHITLKQAGTVVSTLVILANQVVGIGLLSCFFNVNEEVSLTIVQIGSAQVGESLQILLDYRNTDQVDFSSFQTPFILEYEGALVSTSNLLLSYTAPRQMTLAAVQLFSRENVTSIVQVGLYVNSTIVTTFSILAGGQSTQPYALTIQLQPNDLLEARVIVGDPLAAGLLLTLDYFVTSGDNAVAFTYYSDPQQDIVMLCRQVGFGNAKADSVKFENLLKYQQDIDNFLNGRLRALYRTPVAKVSGGTNPWPGALQTIAQRLVMQRLLTDIYSEVEPNVSQNVEKQAALAKEDLDMLLNHETILEGQRLRPRNGGSNPYTEPLTPPAALSPVLPR